MRILVAALLVASLLAGCTGPDRSAFQPPPPPGPRFALDDPRVPVDAFPTIADVGGLLPFPLFGPVVNMTQGASARETSLAVSPRGDGVLFACDPSGVPAIQDGQSYFYLSLDNGTTWEDVDVETSPTDLRQLTFEGGDCDVAIDEAGTLYSADTWLGEIAVGSSKDNGKTWDVGNPMGALAPVADRPWLLGGPPGTVTLSYQDIQFGMPSAIWFATSTDYGLTFSPPVPAVTATPDGPYTWEGNYAISPSRNDIYLVYTRQDGPLHDVDAAKPERVEVAVSHDAGISWTSHLVSARPATASYLYPAIAMDAGGILHVVFSQATGEDRPTFHSFSSDQGVTWSEPAPLLSGVSTASPWVAAGAAGQAIAIWFGSPDPKASASKEADYYLYWARITGAETGNATVQVGTTTREPIYSGSQELGFAEFNQVRLDAHGRAYIGASVPAGQGDDLRWQAVFQLQAEGPAT